MFNNNNRIIYFLGRSNIFFMVDGISRRIKEKSPQDNYDELLKMYNDMEWQPFTSNNIKKIKAIVQEMEALAKKHVEIKTVTLKNFRT